MIAPAALLPSIEGRNGIITSTGADIVSDIIASFLASIRPPVHTSSNDDSNANGTDSKCNLPSHIKYSGGAWASMSLNEGTGQAHNCVARDGLS